MRSKFFLFIIILIGYVGYSLISVDTAIMNVQKYGLLRPGETVGSPVPLKTVEYSGENYWVIPILYGGKVYYFVPVDAETGDIKYAPFVKDVIKVYYLNYMLDKQKLGLTDFLSNFRDDLKKIKLCLDKKVNSYKRIIEILSKLNYSLDDSCLNKEIETRSCINNLIEMLNSFDYEINSVDDIINMKNNLNNIFSKFNECKNLYLNTSDYCVSLYQNITFNLSQRKDNYYQSILSFIQGYNTVFSLDEFTTYFESFDSNEKLKEINDLFDNLDNLVDNFYSRLLDRIKLSKIEKLKQEEQKKLLKLKNETINYISRYSSFLDENQKKEFLELWKGYLELWNETIKMDTNFDKDRFEEKYEKLKQKYEDLKKEVNDELEAVQESYETENESNEGGSNYYLYLVVGGILIVTLLYIFSKKKNKGNNDKDLDDFNDLDDLEIKF